MLRLSSLDFARDDPEPVEGSLSINPEDIRLSSSALSSLPKGSVEALAEWVDLFFKLDYNIYSSWFGSFSLNDRESDEQKRSGYSKRKFN